MILKIKILGCPSKEVTEFNTCSFNLGERGVSSIVFFQLWLHSYLCRWVATATHKAYGRLMFFLLGWCSSMSFFSSSATIDMTIVGDLGKHNGHHGYMFMFFSFFFSFSRCCTLVEAVVFSLYIFMFVLVFVRSYILIEMCMIGTMPFMKKKTRSPIKERHHLLNWERLNSKIYRGSYLVLDEPR